MFDFHVETKIIFGLNSVERLDAEVENLGAKKVLVATDKGIIQAGLLEKITRPLESAGIEFVVFDEIEPNPKDTTILKGAQCMKDAQADIVIGHAQEADRHHVADALVVEDLHIFSPDSAAIFGVASGQICSPMIRSTAVEMRIHKKQAAILQSDE